MIIEIPNENSIVKWKNNDKDEWKVAEISDLIKVYERPQGEWIRTGSLGNGNAHYECSNCHYGDEQAESQEVPYCWHCGADMRENIKRKGTPIEGNNESYNCDNWIP